MYMYHLKLTECYFESSFCSSSPKSVKKEIMERTATRPENVQMVGNVKEWQENVCVCLDWLDSFVSQVTFES